MLRFPTAGESPGPGLVAVVEGVPAGLELDLEALDLDMARRQLGHGRGGRMKIESDAVEIRSGVRHVLERASARETAARVAAGGIARAFLAALGVSIHSHVLQIADVRAPG